MNLKRDDNDPELLVPSVDPDKLKLGIRKVSARNAATARSVMTVRGHEVVTDEPNDGDTGPTPLETTLSALLGCEGVIIYRCAGAMGLRYSGVEMEAEGEVDQRGSRGVRGVRPYFNWVRMTIRIHSGETPERLEKLRRNVEYRCPVMNLFRAADVDVEAVWALVSD